jgi:hypothetical protein
MKSFILPLVALFISASVWSQSCTGLNMGTPGSSNTCLDFDAAAPGAGSAAGCVGGGFGGGGTVRIIQVCTNASTQCVQFDFTNIASGNGTEISLWSTCAAGVLGGYVANSINCYSGSTNIGWSTAGLALSPNTCYYVRVWTKDPPAANSTVCAHVETPSNDLCATPQQIGTAPATYDNYCMTAGSAGDPAAAQFCAGTLENNAWFSFTTLSTCTAPCSVTLTISGINCSGGGSGFQIGYWTGTCGSLTNIGCTSGSGGTVTATINSLSPNQTVIVGIDGNAGAYCNFAISGTNITPLPVGLVDFAGQRNSQFVNLNWQTLSEIRNDYFTLYRSIDGVNWTAITTLDGKTISDELTNYSYIDNFHSNDDVYYRLGQTDEDGNETYLKEISIGPDFGQNTSLTVVPNPVSNGVCELKYVAKRNETSEIYVYDNLGSLLFKQPFETYKGDNSFDMDLSKLQKGIYLVRIQNSVENSDARIVIK